MFILYIFYILVQYILLAKLNICGKIMMTSNKNYYLMWISALIIFTILNNMIILTWVKQIWLTHHPKLDHLNYANEEIISTISQQTIHKLLKEIKKSSQNKNSTTIQTFMFSFFPKIQNFTFSFSPSKFLSSIWERNSSFRANLKALNAHLTRISPHKCKKLSLVGGWSCLKRSDGMK